jgi:hypothetical protein
MPGARFTKADDEYIARHFQSRSYRQIAADLGRTFRSIDYRIKLLRGVLLGTKRRLWTAEEDRQLLEGYQKYGRRTMAKRLDRAVFAVCVRYSKLRKIHPEYRRYAARPAPAAENTLVGGVCVMHRRYEYKYVLTGTKKIWRNGRLRYRAYRVDRFACPRASMVLTWLRPCDLVLVSEWERWYGVKID